jgi:hypothetical protein
MEEFSNGTHLTPKNVVFTWSKRISSLVKENETWCQYTTQDQHGFTTDVDCHRIAYKKKLHYNNNNQAF